MNAKQPYLSVVIPCFNEETNLRLGALSKVSKYLQQVDYEWEAIIVDDGSTDNTINLLNDFLQEHKKFKIIKNAHHGKAQTVSTGIMQAEGQYTLFTDLDQATPLEEFEKFRSWLKEGYKVVIGSRKRKRKGAPWLRSLMGPGFAFIRSKLIGLEEIQDTQCGFKAFSTDEAKKLFQKLKLYESQGEIRGSNVTAGFDVELLFLAKKMGYRIKEVPVDWHYVETRRVNPIRDSWQGLMDILRIKLLDLQGKYR